MKFLFDVCASSRSLISYLTQQGYDVKSDAQVDPHLDDDKIMSLAVSEGYILITEDKDFGTLIFVRILPHPTIFGFIEMTIEDQVKAMQELLTKYSSALLSNSIISVTRWKIRIWP